MRRVENPGDEMRGQITYDLGNGRWITLKATEIERYGLENLLKASGIDIPKNRITVFRDGKGIGSVPAAFEPMAIRSRSFFYTIRPGDFTRTHQGWEVSHSLGSGDLDAVPGFTWSDVKLEAKREGNIASEARMIAEIIRGKALDKP